MESMSGELAVLVDERTFLAIDQARRNALVIPKALGVMAGSALTVRCASDPRSSVRRAVQFVDDADCKEGMTLAGLAWIQPSEIEAVNRKVEAALQVPHFRLQLAMDGGPVSGQGRREILSAGFAQLRMALGAERFDAMPAEALDQFTVMSVIKDHDGRGLIVSLMNSFMIAYVTPETCDKAYACLEELERLRGEVGRVRLGRAQQRH